MLLKYSDDSSFASGLCGFQDSLGTHGNSTPKVYIEVEIEDHRIITAVDTGGVYLVVDPELVHVNPEDGLGHVNLNVRGYDMPGSLHRIPITIPADEGGSLEIETTAFVPDMTTGIPWNFPNFLGWQGCLERMRIAIDPNRNVFYFGSL